MPGSLRVGIDIGSTTIKMVVLDEHSRIVFQQYARHFSDIAAALQSVVGKAQRVLKQKLMSVMVTGSAGIGISQSLGLPFVQEVIAASTAIKNILPYADTAIELGGEDAKITYFSGTVEQRMNGVCAGGTGAFIDHMAGLLSTDPLGLNELAKKFQTIHPIASRCGVFAKTDVQALMNDGAAKEDIAASILQAVVNQTIGSLAQGRTISGNVALLGGPLHFLSELRRRFVETLGLAPHQVLTPDSAAYFVALGAAMAPHPDPVPYELLRKKAAPLTTTSPVSRESVLPPLFQNPEEYHVFIRRHQTNRVIRADLTNCCGDTFLGIDAGSTTMKLVLIDEQGRLLYSSYGSNLGKPLETAIAALKQLYRQLPAQARIAGSAVTGYGEHYIKAALGVDIGEVETIAHLKAARKFAPTVTAVLDIGGQDMKSFCVHNGVIDSIVLNEACSSGCGSFIETFAHALDMPIDEFANLGLKSRQPVDLGTRCTVFMNSKVKQAQKDGASVSDISAGISLSIVKNALFKVIRLKNAADLGDTVVVQGGTFYNDAVLRATEQILEREVIRPDIAGLMGAYGAALIALERSSAGTCTKTSLLSLAALDEFSSCSSSHHCKLCGNQCLITRQHFSNGKEYHVGNRCERGIGKNKPAETIPNLYAYKYHRLFQYEPLAATAAWRGTIGLPRVLNMYEDYPFWFTLFTRLHYQVVLSGRSSRQLYEQGMDTIPSDSICYPAKLVHGHIHDLLVKGVKKIFYPCVPYNEKECQKANNCYNCPVVATYAESVYANMEELRAADVEFMHPFLPLYHDKRLAERLAEVFRQEGLKHKELEAAVQAARTEQLSYKQEIRDMGHKLLQKVLDGHGHAVVLAGRPYHADPEINHGLPEMIASFGLTVISEDAVADLPESLKGQLPVVVDQWSWHSRLYRAAEFVAAHKELELIQLSSFGCGLDAITSDVVKEILERHHRLYTLLKVDEINHISSARIRIRSLLAAMRERIDKHQETDIPAYIPPSFSKTMRNTHVILAPQLSPVHFQFMETALRRAGYKLEIAPLPDRVAVALGLKYVNNDICYPAILVIGQMLRALTSGKYDLNKTSIALFQSGGACRATNYIALMRRALRDAGLGSIPVFSLYGEKSDGFSLSWHLLKDMVKGLLYGDLLMQLLHRVRPYEQEKGAADALYKLMSQLCKDSLAGLTGLSFEQTIKRVTAAFDVLPLRDNVRKPKVGIVGEILVKYHPVANNNIVSYLEAEGAEVILPNMMDFFLYAAYDEQVKRRLLDGTLGNVIKSKLFMKFLDYYRKPLNIALQKSKRFSAYEPLSALIALAEKHLSTGNMAGEGWLLTAEMAKLLRSGIDNIVCLQPFACLPNHVTGKGMIRELLRTDPQANIIALDCDADASQVNQMNRIKLMLEIAKEKLQQAEEKAINA